MDLNFERAEYAEPRDIDGGVARMGPGSTAIGGRFGLALGYGLGAAALGSLGYALIGLSGFMVSIVAIGMGWLVAKAMMTASGGIGGRRYQIAAVVLTYFSVTCGHVLDLYWQLHQRMPSLGEHSVWLSELLLKYAAIGPFLALRSPLNGGIGLLILFFGLRTAWTLAAGGPGFGGGGGRRVGPFGA